jgi:hypothetical protein
VDYRDVTANAADMDEMLGVTNGERRVPVIVEGNIKTIGWAGGS